MSKLHLLTLSLLASFALAFPNPFESRHQKLSRQSKREQLIHSRAESTAAGSVATAWYPGWYGDRFPPSQIQWSKYTSMTFAFAITTADPSVVSLDAQSAAVLPTFVSEAKSNNVNALLSVGGWTGSQYYSTAVASASSRTTFVKTITDLATKYNLDGIDFDWEYPGKQGIGCNVISPDDSANFLLFLQELKQDPVGSKLILTAAVGITPFAGSSGTPMTDVSAFADVLDHVAIMNYDIWGSWSATVGPNAPLADACSSSPQGSATSAIAAWSGAKFPADKIVLGVPAYGHSFFVDSSNALSSNGELALYPAFDKTKQPLGEGETAGTTTDQCGNSVGPSGIFDFQGLIDAGFLGTDGNPASGMKSTFDNCSQTPFVYNPNTQVMISYDDATSFAAKGGFIKSNGLKGFAMWHVAGDSNGILVDAINQAIGGAAGSGSGASNSATSAVSGPSSTTQSAAASTATTATSTGPQCGTKRRRRSTSA